ncbi:MAG: hypothetical protein M3Y17_12885 [Actinomycetota bacterium]|nr:hypothetical protein [Actinomycetota bacterium]
MLKRWGLDHHVAPALGRAAHLIEQRAEAAEGPQNLTANGSERAVVPILAEALIAQSGLVSTEPGSDRTQPDAIPGFPKRSWSDIALWGPLSRVALFEVRWGIEDPRQLPSIQLEILKLAVARWTGRATSGYVILGAPRACWEGVRRTRSVRSVLTAPQRDVLSLFDGESTVAGGRIREQVVEHWKHLYPEGPDLPPPAPEQIRLREVGRATVRAPQPWELRCLRVEPSGSDAGWVARLEDMIPKEPYGEPGTVQHAIWKLDVAHLARLPERGWVPLIDRLHEQLVILDPDYKLGQVKEKFGVLKFYASFEPDVAREAQRLIDKVERRTHQVCERCGASGRLRHTPPRRVDTFCEDCYLAAWTRAGGLNVWARAGRRAKRRHMKGIYEEMRVRRERREAQDREREDGES